MAACREARAGDRLRPLAIGAVVVLAVLLANVAAAGAAPLRHKITSRNTGGAAARRLCPAPRRHAASCLVMALVPSSASAPGARTYEPAGGAAAAGPAGGLTPVDLAKAYGYVGSGGGSEQAVAIVDAYDDPNIESDLATFDSNYGLPACTTGNGCFSKVGQTGSSAVLPAVDKRGWTVEIALDVETVHSGCPNCRILLVEANSEAFADLASAVNEAVTLGATEVSNSYGGLETEVASAERSAYDHPGVVIVAAAGDSGYHNWDRLAEVGVAPGVPDAPASLPTVVSVGGTSLKLTSTAARKAESVWNDSGPPSGRAFKQFAATGGGCSTLFEAPAWQQGLPGWAVTGCGTHRLDNDIAAVGDPYTGFDIYSSYKYASSATTGWVTVGGTSLSSPLIAALYGLAGGSRGAAYPAATLYAHLGQASLYDVTAGGNGYCDGVEPGPCGEPAVNEGYGDLDCLGTTQCDGAVGFDGPAGVGTPNGLGAFGAPPPPTVVSKSATKVTASSAVLNATVNPNGVPVSGCTFEWGTTTLLGQVAPCAVFPGAGSAAVAVSASIGGLASATYYYFRVSATNATAVATGKTLKLKTRA
jgi:hypothetical protein